MSNSLSNTQQSYDSIKKGQEQTLSNISALQSQELSHFNQLNDGLANGSISSQDANGYTQQINEFSNVGSNLYNNLNLNYNLFNTGVQKVQDVMEEQAYGIQLVENSLDEAKERIALIEAERDNKRRLVEISTFYSERYTDHKDIMKTIIFICIPIIIVVFLFNRGLISKNVFILLLVIILLVGGYFLITHILDARSRDNMYYDEYAWDPPKEDKKPTFQDPTQTSDPWKTDCGNNCLSDQIGQFFANSTSGLTNQAAAATGQYPPSTSSTPADYVPSGSSGSSSSSGSSGSSGSSSSSGSSGSSGSSSSGTTQSCQPKDQAISFPQEAIPAGMNPNCSITQMLLNAWNQAGTYVPPEGCTWRPLPYCS